MMLVSTNDNMQVRILQPQTPQDNKAINMHILQIGSWPANGHFCQFFFPPFLGAGFLEPQSYLCNCNHNGSLCSEVGVANVVFEYGGSGLVTVYRSISSGDQIVM